MKLSYTSIFECQAENTLTIGLILQGLRVPAVDNFSVGLWIILWKIREPHLPQDLTFLSLFRFDSDACGKSQKIIQKKFEKKLFVRLTR